MTENYLNILAETIRNNWDQPALTDFYLTEDGKAQDTSRGNRYTYGEMYAEICRVADFLARLGLQKGDHIAICGANSSHWVIAYLAIAKMQGVSVTIMHSLQPNQIAQMVDFSDAKAIIIDRELWQEMQMQQLRHVIAMDDWALLSSSSSEILYEGYAIDRERISILQGSQDELQTICFTSGSTGKPKGVMLSFRNVSASSKGVADACVLHDNKKAVSFLPLSHAYVLGGQVLTPLSYGACIYSLRGLANPVQMFAAIAMIQPYAVFLVPMLVAKLGDERLRPLIPVLVKSLEYMVIGGADFPIETEKSLAAMRVPIAPGYGVTETAALISLSPFSQHRLGASGRVISTLKCRISPAGEILVKGENVMLGYYKDPEATAAKIDKEGWLHTGDKGHLDEDGYLYVEGRLEQDIIVLPNGENIRPDNIESLINAMPEVSESLVLARDGKLVAIVVPIYTIHHTPYTGAAALRRNILRQVNPQLPLFSQLYDIEIIDTPLQRTEKQTIKRYLYS